MSDEDSNFDPSSEFLVEKNAGRTRRRRVEANMKLVNEDTPFTIVGNDSFFKLLYQFHQGSGFANILLTQVCHLSIVLYIIVFSTFWTCIDWQSIHNGTKKKLLDAVYPNCSPEGGRNPIITFTFLVFFSYWIFSTVRAVTFISKMWRMKTIWLGFLGLPNDVKWVSWQSVIDRYHERIDQEVDSYYIVNRIMRWDNYLIALLTKDTLGMNQYGNIFTKMLQWNIHRCLLYTLFRDDEVLIKDVMLRSRTDEYVQQLRKTFLVCGVLNLIGAPFVLCAQTVYFIYRSASEYYKNPKAIGMYTFTPMARWKLRHFNELPHVYTARLNNAHPKILDYLAQFASEGYNIILHFVSFVMGATLFILAAVSYVYPDVIISFIRIEQPIIAYIGTVGAIYAVIHTADELPPSDPHTKFEELLKTLHYSPASWANMSTLGRHQEIRRLFRYKFLVFLQEVASVIYGPFLLMFYMPTKANEIVNFFRENSVHVDKLGIICSSAMFDAERAMIEATDDDIASITSSVGRKTSTSMLNFKRSYPTWDPVRFKRYTISHEMMDEDVVSEDRDLEGDPLNAFSNSDEPCTRQYPQPQNVRDYLAQQVRFNTPTKKEHGYDAVPDTSVTEYGTPMGSSVWAGKVGSYERSLQSDSTGSTYKGGHSYGSPEYFVNEDRKGKKKEKGREGKGKKKEASKIITDYDDDQSEQEHRGQDFNLRESPDMGKNTTSEVDELPFHFDDMNG